MKKEIVWESVHVETSSYLSVFLIINTIFASWPSFQLVFFIFPIQLLFFFRSEYILRMIEQLSSIPLGTREVTLSSARILTNEMQALFTGYLE